MGQSLIQVDAFTTVPFAGNPAAVCVLSEERSDEWMQKVALEMNLSETAFLVKQPDGYRLRWFTPAVEVELCGHATLAAAHVLWSEGHLEAGAIAQFHTLSGLLTAQLEDGWITLNFPTTPCTEVEAPAGLVEALGVSKALYVGKNQFDYLVQVEDETLVRQMQPNLGQLRSLPTRGIIVTSAGTHSDYDFVSRFFAPGSGIDEDPVTGSAHCTLAPFWGDRLHKTQFLAYQASPRGGEVRVNWEGDRVLLAGQAVTVMRAELTV